MADVLPADLVVLYQDAFAHFDSLKNGMISTKLLGPLLRHCGENPSESEIQVRNSFFWWWSGAKTNHIQHYVRLAIRQANYSLKAALFGQ